MHTPRYSNQNNSAPAYIPGPRDQGGSKSLTSKFKNKQDRKPGTRIKPTRQKHEQDRNTSIIKNVAPTRSTDAAHTYNPLHVRSSRQVGPACTCTRTHVPAQQAQTWPTCPRRPTAAQARSAYGNTASDPPQGPHSASTPSPLR